MGGMGGLGGLGGRAAQAIEGRLGGVDVYTLVRVRLSFA